MRTACRALACALLLALFMTPAALAFAYSEVHPPTNAPDFTPVSPNPITQYPGSPPYRAKTDCGPCHGTQKGSADNNHGLMLRPILSGPTSVWSDNPFFAALPSVADFSVTGGANRASWVFGGNSIGAEMYIYQANSGTYLYPRVGNQLWEMDYNNAMAPLRRGSFVPGYNNQSGAVTTAWADFAGVNYFTGTSSPTQQPNEYGCVNCHAFGARVLTDPGTGLPTAYQVQEWGVTCANCHGSTTANPVTIHSIPVPFNSQTCYRCHDRQPVYSTPGVPARPQQLAMDVWNTGQAKDNYMQGFEVRKAVVQPGPFVPGTTETTGGAGHNHSLVALQSFTTQQYCLRCHSTLGYLAHSVDNTDVPYAFVWPAYQATLKSYPVTKSLTTNANDDCVTCHTSHDYELGLNSFGLRIPPQNSYDAGSPNDPAWRVCSDCHRESGYPFLPYRGTFGLGKNRMDHPQREMFLGYGGYGVSYAASTHLAAEVWCQYCHMPNSVAEPYADTSHLFQIVWPSQTMSMQTIGFRAWPAGATTTTPSPGAPTYFPDDSCTGKGCHLPSAEQISDAGGDINIAQDEVKTFLQERGTYWQSTISTLLSQAQSKLDDTEPIYGDTTAWKMAQINVWLVSTDGSVGVHNFQYAKSLLDWANNTLDGLASARLTTLTIAATNTKPGYQQEFFVNGTLSASGTPVPNQPLKLQSSTDGGTNWVDVPNAGLNSQNGSFTWLVDDGLTSTLAYRWLYEGAAGQYLPSVSPTIFVSPKVSLSHPTAKSGTLKRQTKYTFSGTFRPRYPAGGLNVYIRLSRFSNGKWTSYSTPGWPAVNANSGSGSKYSRLQSFNTAGTWRAQAYFQPTPGNSATFSSSWTFKVK